MTDSDAQTNPKLQSQLRLVAEAIEDQYEKTDETFRFKGVCPGLASGYVGIDNVISGFHPGDLIVIAGRPNMCADSLAMGIASNVVFNGTAVKYFSMSKTSIRLTQHLLASASRLSMRKIVTGNLEDDDFPDLTHGLGKLSQAPLELLDSTSLEWSVCQLEEHVANDPSTTGLLVVEDIHLLDVTNVSSSYDRNIQLGEQVRQLKKMAMRLGFPILVTASLNREPELRPNKRPVMRDLRDIGMLEDIADVVLLMYRDEVYNPDSSDKGLVEVIVAKQPRGPTGTIMLYFIEESCCFIDI